jgi:hypothetical protein
MKKKLLFFIVFIPVSIFSQFHSNAIKFGYFEPAATSGGFIIGYEGGKYFDRNFSFGWSIDWFHKSFVDQKLVEEFNYMFGIANYTINELRAKTNLHSIPLMFKVTGCIPIAPRMKAFINGGLGAEVLLIFYSNYQNPNKDEFTGAFDFNWNVGTGIMFALGRNSDIFFEIAYHFSEPSWTYEMNDVNSSYTRIFERRYDMSGIMTRVGFRFYY